MAEFGSLNGGSVVIDANNPLPVDVISGNITGTFAIASVGLVGQTAPTSADQIGILVGSLLEPVSYSNPIPTQGVIQQPAAGNITIQDTGSTVTAGYNNINSITGSPTAGSFYSKSCQVDGIARIQITGTWTGTLVFEGTMDSGTTWHPAAVKQIGSSYTTGSTTGNGEFVQVIAGYVSFRVRASAAITGTAVVQAVFAPQAGAVEVLNPLRLWDNTSGVNFTIKAGSTLSATTDTAIVVTTRDTVATQPNRASTGTQSSVGSANTSGTILAANANRLGGTIVNDSTAILYLLLVTGGTASATAYTVALPPAGVVGAYYELPAGYTGAVIGIWVSVNGNARVTEFTA